MDIADLDGGKGERAPLARCLLTGAAADGSDPYCVFVLGDEEIKSKVQHT